MARMPIFAAVLKPDAKGRFLRRCGRGYAGAGGRSLRFLMTASNISPNGYAFE